MPTTTKDASGFRMDELVCPKCDKQKVLCREFSAHFAGLAEHVSGAWSLCSWCGFEWMSFHVTEEELSPPLRGDHELVHASMG